MKKIIFTKIGKPEDILELQDVPLPEPQAGEVRIKIKAANINPADIMFVQNLYGIRPQLPSGAGFEGMGEIDACGEGVNLKTGSRVSVATIGTWAEYAIVPAKACLPVPDNIANETAAQLFVNPFTAFAMVCESKVQPGGWLMLTAAGSAFSQVVIQLCKLQGIKTIGTVRRNDQTEQLKALGCDVVLNLTEQNAFKEVMKLTEGKGVTCVLEAVGGQTAADALLCLAHGGTMLSYGALSLDPIPVNSGLMIFKNLTLKGFWLTEWMKNTAQVVEAYQSLIELLGTGQVQLAVEAKYPLADFKQALAHFEKPGRKGKILLINP